MANLSKAKATQQADEQSEYVKECTSILPAEQIEDEFRRVSADLAYWNNKFADALREHLRAKATEKQVRASVYLEIRSGAAEKGEKLTEAMTDAKVETHEDVRDAVDRCIHAEASKARMYGMVDAVRSKKDMLVSIGAQVRAEMQGDPMLRKEAREHRQLGDEG